MKNNTKITTEESQLKCKPGVITRWACGVDGRDGHYYISYVCPFCNNAIQEDTKFCSCGTVFEWSKKAKIIIRPDIVWE